MLLFLPGLLRVPARRAGPPARRRENAGTGIGFLSFFLRSILILNSCFFQVAFLAHDSAVHFYSMPDGASQPTQLTVSDVDGEKYRLFSVKNKIGLVWFIEGFMPMLEVYSQTTG